ncbi:MAG: alanine--tRNA ligase [Myxococcota bacterium]|nr:alanine--tRNA ligase [Myxococcota bacterium]
MKTMTAAELRSQFLDFFAQHGHTKVKSAPLIPANDPTLMFTAAGMVQFKDVFVGAEKRDYTRAASCQKCMRVSGKHNDLEEVGRTSRHHTFFEMLGNFSFGDYFKEEAIEMAWKLLTEELEIDSSKLWVTVFGGEEGIAADTEAREIWKRVSGLPDERILDMGMKDNFWAAGDTGPCGPCTEIHYDTGGDTPPTLEDFESGRVVEIWNNVFMQFERLPSGELIDLPKPSVDTGMGLERLAALMQGQLSNYHTDLFMPLLQLTSELVGKAYQKSDSEDDVSMRVIADHARATAFLVADGVQPSNEGRGYVMRRIMRRAIRHGHRLGFSELFFHKVCTRVVDTMGDAYPELKDAAALIQKVAELEETSFRRTLESGLKILEDEIGKLGSSQELAGETVFKLYDTYGFPKDLTELIAFERHITIDEAGFDAAMKAQQERSRGSQVGDQAVGAIYKELALEHGEVAFVGYTHEDEPIESREGPWRLQEINGTGCLQVETRVVALLADGKTVESAEAGDIEVVLNPTPFYGEAGGQVGDTGFLWTDDGFCAEVGNTQKPVDKFTVSHARIKQGALKVGQSLWAGYEPAGRKQIRAHHSATHILHASLRTVLGEHVKQAGSLVEAGRLRFDYSHFEAPTDEHIRNIEADANQQVMQGAPVVTDVLPFDEAKERGAIALFGEKYGDVVRVVTMGDSVEFCGGTHAKNTRDIDLVIVSRDEAIASGVRRIEAEVGTAARARAINHYEKLSQAAALINEGTLPDHLEDETILTALAKTMKTHHTQIEQLKAAGMPSTELQLQAKAPTLNEDFGFAEAQKGRDLWQGLIKVINGRPLEEAYIKGIDAGNLIGTLLDVQQANKANERQLKKSKQAALGAQAGDMVSSAEDIKGIRVLATKVEGISGKGLRDLADQLRPKLSSGILCLGAESDGRASLLIAVSKDLTSEFRAGDLMRELAPHIDGKGGGKPELAQGGGTNPDGFAALFDALKARLNTRA